MKVCLCYRKSDTPKNKILVQGEYPTIKAALKVWHEEIEKIAITGYLRKWNIWDFSIVKWLKKEDNNAKN